MNFMSQRANHYDSAEQNRITGSITVYLCKKGIPAILAVMIVSLHNLVDTYFVSKSGSSAIAAISVVYAGITLVQTLAYVIGMGASGMISTAIGKEQKEEAIGCIRAGCWLAVITAVGILIIEITIPEPLLRWLGATDSSLIYAMEYARYVIWSAPAMLLQMVLGNLLRGLNNTSGFMLSSIIGGGMHILLCWWFVAYMHFGIAGAGVATLVGQLVSLVFLVVYWWKKACIITFGDVFQRKNRNESFLSGTKMACRILKNGLPSLARQGSASLSLILLNQVAGRYSDEMLSAISIANKIMMLCYAVAIGLSQGYQPMAGFLHGAGKQKRLRKVFYVTLAEGSMLLALMGVTAYYTASRTIGLFYAKGMAYEMAIAVFGWQTYTLPVSFLNNLVTISYQTMQSAIPASILAMLRQGICYIPLLYVLPSFFGIDGFVYLQPGAEVLTFLVTVPFAVHFLKKSRACED